MGRMDGPHADLLREALAAEGPGQRALLAGDDEQARTALREAVRLYRASWEIAPPASWGRLIGALKAAIIAGSGREEAAFVRANVPDEAAAGSAPASYALAIAALVEGDDARAAELTQGMRGGSPAFVRAAAAIDALAAREAAAYAAAVQAIVDDFAGRDEHLTGVPIADTAVMLECLAAPRGLASRPASPLLPRQAV
jgi:hypothetical protein